MDQAGDGGGGAAGGEDIIDDEDVLARLDGIGVHFEAVGAIFEVVIDAADDVGQLFGFANRDESGAESMGHGRSKEIAAGFDADHDVDGFPAIVLLQGVDRLSESVLVFEQGGDVVELDSWLGKVGDLAD